MLKYIYNILCIKMQITNTGLVILKYLLSNNNRNRKITRSNMSRDIRKSVSQIYENSRKLLKNDLIYYTKIDNNKAEIGLTLKGEEYILSEYYDKI